ncbi:MAG: class I SAM-dependent methyltransferase [Patescibacteria group bacterium]|nr:class I SAM-dependent methyltransferase [Patescibacteria group bacterium]
MLIIFTVLKIIYILCIFSVLVLLFLWIWSLIRTKVPFFPTPKKVFPYINKALNLKEEDVVYDLGCGDGRVLFYLSKLNRKVKCIGVENGPFPILLARINRVLKNKNVSILNKNIFKHNYSDATHIYMYMYPRIMDDILTKFDRELKKGTKVISVFQFTVKRPIAVIDLKRESKFQLVRKFYVYEF